MEKETYRNKDWLKKQYHDEKRSALSIAVECGISKATVLNWLAKFKIKKRRRGRPEETEEEHISRLHEDIKNKERLAEEYKRLRDFLDNEKLSNLSTLDIAYRQRAKRTKEKAARQHLHLKEMKRDQNTGGVSTSYRFSAVDELTQWQEIHDQPCKR